MVFSFGVHADDDVVYCGGEGWVVAQLALVSGRSVVYQLDVKDVRPGGFMVLDVDILNVLCGVVRSPCWTGRRAVWVMWVWVYSLLGGVVCVG